MNNFISYRLIDHKIEIASNAVEFPYGLMVRTRIDKTNKPDDNFLKMRITFGYNRRE